MKSLLAEALLAWPAALAPEPEPMPQIVCTKIGEYPGVDILLCLMKRPVLPPPSKDREREA